jgi:carbamoyltransferase
MIKSEASIARPVVSDHAERRVRSRVIGIHLGHNSAAALVENGELLFAQQEERLTRTKNQGGLPRGTLRQIGRSLREDLPPVARGIALAGSNLTGCAWQREAILRFSGLGAPTAMARLKGLAYKQPIVSAWINHRKWRRIENEADQCLGGSSASAMGVSHHLCHAASAYFGWGNLDEDILVLTCDGAGDSLCATVNIGRRGAIETIARLGESESLGALYAKITYLLGMVPMEHEYKLMGLAPYAETCDEALKLSRAFEDVLAPDAESPMLWRRRNGCPPLQFSASFLERLLKRRRFDHIAAGLQLFVEKFLVRWVEACIRETGIHRVALSGGVFMNVKANQRILESPEVEQLYIFPSCGDESNAIGAAWLRSREIDGQNPHALGSLYLGSEFSMDEIQQAIDAHRFSARINIQEERDIEKRVAMLLVGGEIVARYKGKMEFGARALGDRSILASASAPGIVKTINAMIKCRDFWMPFAPSVLIERSEEYFKKPKPMPAPYMIITFETQERKRNAMCNALHPYDATGRPQEVMEEWNPEYYRLLKYYESMTGEGIVLNTSFNLHGEPVVSSPEDALRVFDVSGLQHLAIGDYLLSKQ